MESLVKSNVGKMEDNTKEGRSMMMIKELVEFFQAVLGKKKLLV